MEKMAQCEQFNTVKWVGCVVNLKQALEYKLSDEDKEKVTNVLESC